MSNRRRYWLLRVLAALTASCVAAVGLGGPAVAAVPDRFGFVLWNGAATVPSGTFPAANTVVPIAGPRYVVTFVGQAAPGGVVHVTAINPVPHWCQVDQFGPSGLNEVALISCHRIGGALDLSGFSVSFSRSSGPPTVPTGRFGYVDSTAAGVLVSQYNSALAANTVVHIGLGQWVVNLPGLGTPGPLDGSVQATAVNPNAPARCKVARWLSTPAGQRVLIYCFDAAGAFLDTRFTMTYQFERALTGGLAPPKVFGYLWNNPPLGPPSTNFNSQAAINSIVAAGVGLWLVQFRSLAVLPDNIQVTATGPTSDFCGLLTTWAHFATDTLVRDVNCFTNAGAPSPGSGFLISDNSVL